MLGIIPFTNKKNGNRTDSSGSLPVAQLRWDMDRVFDRFLSDFWGVDQGAASPAIRLDVRETAEDVIVTAEVPGIEPNDLEVNLAGEILTISGEKREVTESAQTNLHYSERRYGTFQRAIQLPCAVEPDEVSAEHANGVVTIRLEKSQALRPKRINVQPAKATSSR